MAVKVSRIGDKVGIFNDPPLISVADMGDIPCGMVYSFSNQLAKLNGL
jgi:hypothetical protein